MHNLPNLPTNGWINALKHEGITSNALLGRIKRELGRNIKAGHAGTLDPFASGVLPIALGKATKLVSYITNSKKVYEFDIHFGYETDTLDLTGIKTASTELIPKSLYSIEEAVQNFLGTTQQMIPVYSAAKINGKRFYDMARNNIDPPKRLKPITIYSLKVLKFENNIATLVVECSSGTYVRSLARDIAYAVGSLGTTTRLVRTSVGCFAIDSAVDIRINAPLIHDILWPIKFPHVHISEQERKELMDGKPFSRICNQQQPGTHVCLVTDRQLLVGICAVGLGGALTVLKRI